MVWVGRSRAETRNSAGTVTAQFFTGGELISGTKYCFAGRSDGSPTEMTNSSGTIVGQQTYDLYGRPTQLQGTMVPDFGFAGYYLHAPSGLGLTRTRAYNASLGRFINRDPIGIRGGVNLYAYVGNGPSTEIDPSGMQTLVMPNPQAMAAYAILVILGYILSNPNNYILPIANPWGYDLPPSFGGGGGGGDATVPTGQLPAYAEPNSPLNPSWNQPAGGGICQNAAPEDPDAPRDPNLPYGAPGGPLGPPSPTPADDNPNNPYNFSDPNNPINDPQDPRYVSPGNRASNNPEGPSPGGGVGDSTDQPYTQGPGDQSAIRNLNRGFYGF